MLDQVIADNPHFSQLPTLDNYTHAKECDPWAFERGYTHVLTFRAGFYKAVYGWHVPTLCWHLWMN